jgi:membrane protease YdiL (CAAX protease family)
MANRRLGETKGPLIAWFFTLLCFAVPVLLLRGSGQPVPQQPSPLLILWLLYNVAVPWGIVIIFLIVFLAYWEKNRSLKGIFTSLGLKREGAAKSIAWTLALAPFFLIVYLLLTLFSVFLGPIPFLRIAGPVSSTIPAWYPFYMIAYAFFPVAIVEEALARGYILDRLLAEHPSTLRRALPALLLSSVLFTLYHLPGYLGVYSFSAPWTIALLAGNVFPWSLVLGVAYVRAHARNIVGPVLIHFLADAVPMMLLIPLTVPP